jgi:hypothetical protein
LHHTRAPIYVTLLLQTALLVHFCCNMCYTVVTLLLHYARHPGPHLCIVFLVCSASALVRDG